MRRWGGGYRGAGGVGGGYYRGCMAMIRLSPVSLRKNGRVTGSVEPDGSGPSQPVNERAVVFWPSSGVVPRVRPGAPVTAYRTRARPRRPTTSELLRRATPDGLSVARP